MKHTQGKWIKNGIHSIDRNESVTITSGENLIARVNCLFDGKNNLEKGKEAEANAKLIVQAPELLHRLKLAVEFLEHTMSSDNLELLAMKEAINKATK